MPISIHGKQYNTVAERIKEADKDLLEVFTEVLFIDPVVIKATIKTSKGMFSGISAANASKQIEKESPYEVAETSAVGRALAFAGYGTTDAIASVEEMKKAGVTSSTAPQRTITTPTNEFSNSKCKDCGGGIKISAGGKPYCSNKCWLPEGAHFRTEFNKVEDIIIPDDGEPLPF